MLSSHESVKWAVTVLAVIAAMMLITAAAQAGPVLHVDDDAPLSDDGLSWNTAYRFLADALADASGGGISEIRVGQGTYQPDRDEANPKGSGDRGATFQLINGISLMGGFAGLGAPDPDARDTALYETILSGDLAGDDLPGFVNNGENSIHVVTGSGTNGTALIDGLTITAGNGSSGGAFVANSGAGMVNQIGSPTVKNCTFTGNRAFNSGGGMLNFDFSFPAVINCIFIGNRTDGNGGGMNNHTNSAPTLVNCMFTGNSATSLVGGGGIYNVNSSSALVINCTLSGNSAPNGIGGGMAIVINSIATVKNSILWGNTDSGPIDESSQIAADLGTVVVNYSCIQGLTGNLGGTGNIGLDPMFADPDGADDVVGTEDDDLRLQVGSPCIDAANNAAVPSDTFDLDGDGNTAEPIPIDLDGNARFLDDPNVVDTGLGTPPIVDMGAFEGGGPVEFLWLAQFGGEFGAGLNWNGGTPPGPLATPVFDGVAQPNPAFYFVFFTNDEVTDRLIVRSQRDVRLQMGDGILSHDYQVRGLVAPNEPSIIVGDSPFLDARLRIENPPPSVELHGVFGSIVSVADTADSLGTLTVAGPFTLFGSAELFVGRQGQGLVAIEQGAGATAIGDVSIGSLASGLGELRVSGAGSQFTYEGFDIVTLASLSVGQGGSGMLTVENGGSLVGATLTELVSIASDPGSIGDVLLTGPGSQWTANGSVFYVAESGEAALTIADGAQLRSTTLGQVILALNAGSTAQVTVAGRGSAWTETLAPLFIAGEGDATVTLADGGSIQFPAIGVDPQGKLLGDGSLVGDVINVGEIRPGEAALPATSGVLSITGTYRQIGIPVGGGFEDSGSLYIDLAGTTPGVDHDQLIITGQAELGGGLFVNVVAPFEPQPGQSFAFLDPGSIDPMHPTFDVAFMPGFPDDRFMQVSYGAPGVAGVGASIVVGTLTDLFGFDLPESVGIAGLPSGVAVGDFDNQNGIDLAITLPNENPLMNGSVLVLLNAGTDGMGTWLGFSGTTQTTVGKEPSGITVGFFDNDSDLDIAVTNAGDDNVLVLLNTGVGDGTFNLEPPIVVGDQPAAIAAGDFNEDTFIDLAVANGGDDNVQVFSNNGMAVFIPFPGGAIAVGLGPVVLVSEDLDNDKCLDLLVANQESDTVSVLFNLAGTFADAVHLAVGDAPVALTTGDFDGNGVADIVTANNSDGTVSVILSNGDQTFTPAVNLPVGSLPRSITAIDLELDGDLDVAVVANNEADTAAVVQILRNDIEGGVQLIFADAEDFDVGEDPAFVLSGNLDGDLADDLITINEGIGAPGGVAEQEAGPEVGSVNVLINAFDPSPADITGPLGVADGCVDAFDLAVLLNAWCSAVNDPNPPSPPCENCTPANLAIADISGAANAPDGCVDAFDLAKLLAEWCSVAGGNPCGTCLP